MYLKEQQRVSVARVLSVHGESTVEVASYGDSAMKKTHVSEEQLIAIQAR